MKIAHENAEELVALPMACQMMSISRASAYRWAAESPPRFPPIRKLGKFKSAVRLSELRAFIDRVK
jgi:predicted DNA-binding transcriptional regulator AlpA